MQNMATLSDAKIFSVADVRNAVGSRRQIDVIDCRDDGFFYQAFRLMEVYLLMYL